MGGGAVIAAARDLNPAGQISDATDRATTAVSGAVSGITDKLESAGKSIASYFGSDSTAPAQESLANTKVAQSQAAADELTVRKYLRDHPDDPLGIMKKPATAAAPAADGSTPSTGDYQGTDLFGNPITVPASQRGEAASGGLSSLSPEFQKAHPNINTAYNIAPYILAAVGLGKAFYGPGAAAGAEAAATRAPLDIAGKSPDSPNIPNTSEHFNSDAVLNHPDATPELQAAVKSLKPAIRDPDTGETYLANDPNAKNHFEVFADLPKEIADKPSLDSGFVGPEGEYMTRQQAADHLIAAQATGTPRPVSGEVMVGPAGASAAAKPVSEAAGATEAGSPAATSGGAQPAVPAAAEAGLRLGPARVLKNADGEPTPYSEHPLVDPKTGDKVGEIGVYYDPTTDKATAQIRVAQVNQQYQGRSLVGAFKQLKTLYPDVEQFQGERQTGLHRGFNTYDVAPRASAVEAATPAAAAQSLAEKQLAVPAAAEAGHTPLNEMADFAQRRAQALQEATRGLEPNPETGLVTRRPRAADLAEAAANPVTAADVEAMQPGTRRLASENVALGDFIHSEASDLQTTAIKAAQSGDPADTQVVISKFLSLGLSHEPKLQAALSEAGRGVGILNDPVAGKNQYIRQFTDLFNNIASGKAEYSQDDLVHAIAGLQTPAQVAEFSRNLTANGGIGLTRNAFLNAWVNGLLSFNTVAKKTVSDGYHLMYQIGARSLAEAGGYVQRSLGADPGGTVSPGETMSMIRAAHGTFLDAARIAYSSFKDDVPWFNRIANLADTGIGFGEGIPHQEISSIGTRFENTALGSGIDFMGHLIGLPSRGIMAVDQFSKMMAYRMELNAEVQHAAWTEASSKGLLGKDFADYVANRSDYLLGHPPISAQQAALNGTKLATFTQQIGGPGMVGKFQRALQGAQQTEIGTMIMPFYSTPTNIASASLEESPLGMASAGYRNAMESGDPRTAAIAKGTVGLGTLMTAAAMYLIHNGNVTGAAPQNPQLRDFWLRNHQEYAFEFNNPLTGKRESFQYGQVEPIGTIFGVAADLANGENQMSQTNMSSQLGLLAVVASQQLERQTFFKNFVSIVHLLDAGEKGVEGAAKDLGNLVGSVIPSNAANLAKGIDPAVHEIRGIGDAILARTPGLSKTLPPELNIFGEPVLRQPGYLLNQVSVLKHMTLPAPGEDKATDEILRLGRPLPDVPWTIAGTAPNPLQPDTGKTGIPLNAEEHHRLEELVGAGMRARIEHLMTSPEYARHTDAEKSEALEGEIRDKINVAQEALLKERSAANGYHGDADLMQRWLDRINAKKALMGAGAAAPAAGATP